MSTYRYNIEDDGTITRGTRTHVGDSDTWRNYWDGDGIVGFTVHYRGAAGPDINMITDDEDTERAVAAWRAERNGERGSDGGLDRLAVRLGSEDSCFMQISLDRALDFIILSWSGESSEWRDEIEEVWHGEVYRIDAEQQVTNLSNGEPMWLSMDSDCTDYYGLDSVLDELAKQFPLTEYPAETQVTGSD